MALQVAPFRGRGVVGVGVVTPDRGRTGRRAGSGPRSEPWPGSVRESGLLPGAWRGAERPPRLGTAPRVQAGGGIGTVVVVVVVVVVVFVVVVAV